MSAKYCNKKSNCSDESEFIDVQEIIKRTYSTKPAERRAALKGRVLFLNPNSFVGREFVVLYSFCVFSSFRNVSVSREEGH
jgi:hypothetical protein